MAAPPIPPIAIPDACTNDPPAEPGYRAFKGIDKYQDTLGGVKAALVDVVKDFNAFVGDYTAPLATKESICRGGLKAQGK